MTLYSHIRSPKVEIPDDTRRFPEPGSAFPNPWNRIPQARLWNLRFIRAKFPSLQVADGIGTADKGGENQLAAESQNLGQTLLSESYPWKEELSKKKLSGRHVATINCLGLPEDLR